MYCAYPKFDFKQSLSGSSCHVCFAKLKGFEPYLKDYRVILSKEELLRSANQAFVISRALLRMCLASYLNLAPQEVSIFYTEKGKPVLNSSQSLYFNLSHSQGHLAMIFSKEPGVGIDIELRKRSIPFKKIANRFFHPNEARLLSTLEGEALRSRFFRYWTLKEAYAKAIGDGVSLFPHFEIQLENSGLAQLKGDNSWVLGDLLNEDEAFVAAYAKKGELGPLSIFHYGCCPP